MQRTYSRRIRWAAALLAGGCLMLFAVHHANAHHCTAASSWCDVSEVDERRERRYVVDALSFGGVLHPEEVITAVVTAADLWNEQGNSGTFRYVGKTAGRQFDCSQGHLPGFFDDSYVAFGLPGCGLTYSTWSTRECGGEKFVIWICPYRPWAVGDPAPGEQDLLKALVREFGNLFCYDNPPSTPSILDEQQSAGIDLYEWDLGCSAEIAGNRVLGDAFRFHNSDGSFSTEDTNETEHQKIAAGASWTSGTVRKSRTWSSSYPLYCSSWSWLNGTGDSGCLGPPDNMGLTLATWRENQPLGPEDFVVAVDLREEPSGSYFASHYLRTWFSGDFTAGIGNGNVGVGLFREAGVGGENWIKTARPLAVAYDNLQDTTISAWVLQNRGQPDDLEIRVASGMPPITTKDEAGYWRVFVGESHDLAGARSIVSPGLACHESDAGGWNCIIAYVERDDPDSQYVLNRVLVKRFTLWNGFSMDIDPTTYRVVDDSVSPSIAFRTASRIAAWFRAGKFWIAVRQLKRGQQRLEVASSPDGAVWTAGANLGYSTLGPTVAPYFFGKNVLMYSKDLSYYYP